jgi:hypothetical protein
MYYQRKMRTEIIVSSNCPHNIFSKTLLEKSHYQRYLSKWQRLLWRSLSPSPSPFSFDVDHKARKDFLTPPTPNKTKGPHVRGAFFIPRGKEHCWLWGQGTTEKALNKGSLLCFLQLVTINSHSWPFYMSPWQPAIHQIYYPKKKKSLGLSCVLGCLFP